jgi:Ni,Fe-hydrogenase I cytochrome b subunit
MTFQTSSSREKPSIFIERHSALIRIWHWLTFLFVTSLVITVLLASTVLNPRENVPVVQNVLKSKGITADNNQTFAVTHLYDDKMWDLHKLLGYGLAFLFMSRVVIEFMQSEEEKNPARIKKALFAFLQSGKPEEKKELRHYLIVKYSYMLFYGILLVMVITGLTIAFGGDFGLSGPTRHNIKEIHGFVQYFIYAFVIFHLAGIILADLGKAKGIVSGMINGGK